MVGGHWQTISMIGAIAMDGIRSMITINSGTTTDVFEAYVTQQLAPSLRPGDIVVMDNLNVHKNERCVQAIRDAGADVLYLPPYSPEFNPIEKTWAKMKDILRKLNTMTREAFDAAVVVAMDAISIADCRAWIAHAGYTVN